MPLSNVTLLSLNIECDKHYDTVTALLRTRCPEVICLQEVTRDFCEQVATGMGYTWEFFSMGESAPHGKTPSTEKGVMIGWKDTLVLERVTPLVYHSHDPVFPVWDAHNPDSYARVLLSADLKKDDEHFRFATTHFTWTPDSSASDAQRNDMRALLCTLEQFDDEIGIVYCGDFNAPRGGEIFAMMSEQYTDNLPPLVLTTLDQTLHRAAPLLLAVDSIFSSKEYVLHDVALIDGVSDHMALFAHVARNVG